MRLEDHRERERERVRSIDGEREREKELFTKKLFFLFHHQGRAERERGKRERGEIKSEK